MTIWWSHIAAFTLDQNTIGQLHQMVIAIIDYSGVPVVPWQHCRTRLDACAPQICVTYLLANALDSLLTFDLKLDLSKMTDGVPPRTDPCGNSMRTWIVLKDTVQLTDPKNPLGVRMSGIFLLQKYAVANLALKFAFRRCIIFLQ